MFVDFLWENGKSEFFYGINNLSDKDPATAWVEGNPSEGIGEYILLFVPRINEKGRRLSFSYDEDNDIKIFLNVTNGYCKSEDLFYKNNRVKKARITIYDVPVTASVNSIYVKGEPVKIKEEIIELTDDLKIPQSFTFITKLNKNKDAPKPKVVLKFEILEVYKGTKYNDTAISEIEVWGGICNKIVEFFFCRHVVVCIGYTAKTLIFHDPYGNLEKGKNNQYGSDKNGAYVEYPKNKYRIGKNWIRYLSEKEDK